MNTDNQQLQTLRVLILKSQSESLSESEIVELNALICSEDGAVEAAALIDQLCAFSDSGGLDSLPMAEVLSEAFSQEKPGDTLSAAANPPSPKNVPGTLLGANIPLSRERADSSSQLDRWTKAYWWVGLAASHLFIASLAWSLAKPSSINAPIANLPTANLPAAEFTSEARSPQLVSTTACVWRTSGDLVPTIGEPIASGEVLNLVEGIAELRVGEKTPGEAIVRIEGPAAVFFHADGHIGLQHGTLTAKSLGTGTGNFILDTPIGQVALDGHSSIGLVSQGAVNEVHLFKGRALVKPTSSISVDTDLVLEEGDAVRYSSKPDEDVQIVKFEASLSSFASARTSSFDPLNLGQTYVDAVVNSLPSIYWRFEQVSGETPHYVQNQGSAPNMDAVVVGNPSWRQYGDNRVAELGLSAASSAFRSMSSWPATPLDEYTIEMWVKPQLFHHGEVICLHDQEELDDGRYQHTMMLEATAQHYFTHRLKDSLPNRFRFVHRALGSGQPISATSLFSDQQYQARVWQHVVAQKKENRQMLWIDGQLSAERENPVPLNKNVQILVGQVYPTSVYRRFVGQIDEVAIYDRCLPPEELRSHIKAAGRPVVTENSN